VGKTKLALELAQLLTGEIISADSRYLYRGADIGTAKPSLEERAVVLHHLIDVADPDQPWSLAEYSTAVTQLITEINQRKHLPVLVGGTGQYIFSILEGWSIPRGAADPELRAKLEATAEQIGGAALYQQLKEVDPLAASQIDPRNVRRVIRALEVTLTSGQPFSAQRLKSPPNYQVFIVGLTLPRVELYRRIDARVDSMFAAGWVAEVQTLVAKGYEWSLPAMSAIGYQQIGQYLRGEMTLEEAIRSIKHTTRVFVRRQANWFKATDPRIHWYDARSVDPAALASDLQTYFDHNSPL
jgi:tRNA dimethylallyltransferase